MAGRLELNVEDVVKITWGELEGLIDWKGNEGKKKEIDDIIRNRASLEVRHVNALADLPEEPDEDKLASKMGLTKKDIEDLKEGFAFDTFKMEIQKDLTARYLRDKKDFLESTPLTSLRGIAISSAFQIASLIIEIVMFVLGVIGIRVSLKEAQLRKIIQEVMPIVQQPAFRRIINQFLASWNGGSAFQKAKAIFYLLKEVKGFGIFWKIVKAAIEDMSWWERIKALAEVAAMIVATFATDGIALIARIALSVSSAYKIAEKVANLLKLEGMASETH